MGAKGRRRRRPPWWLVALAAAGILAGYRHRRLGAAEGGPMPTPPR
ncbi:MAG TPA: hypothetical protein VMN58_08790 [Acidimicrobiales bacterium]|nr:hypothetical protein [Acidimicrobiales bacterium]